jgi:trehalose/maltose transport system permease protein
MTALSQPQRSSSASSLENLLTLATGVLFILIGVGAWVLLINSILSITGTAAPDETTGTTLLRFLETYGLIIPILEILAGVLAIAFGIGVIMLNARQAAWARQAYLWLCVACVVFVLQGFSAGTSTLPGQPGSVGQGVQNALPFLLAGIVFALAWYWLGQVMPRFRGGETLEQASARNAWNLLIPTLVVLIVVAARPLERTFIASLTNDRFASNEPAAFVGFDNYAQLLGLRIDSIPCVRDDATGACARDEDGVVQFPRARDALDEGYLQLRYRELGSGLVIGENRLILSARDQNFWNAVGNTLLFTFGSVSIELLLGLFFALVINSKFAGRGLLRTALLVPWAIPTVVSARLWELMLRDNSSGIINSLGLQLGLWSSSQAWLANADLQIPALIAVDVWKTTPFMALLLLAGLQVISRDIYEAAEVDGASKIRQFFSITLPLLRPAIAVALVFRTLDSIRVFDVFQVLLGRARLSMATYNYETLVSNQELGYASAIGVLIFAIILIFTILYVRILNVRAE